MGLFRKKNGQGASASPASPEKGEGQTPERRAELELEIQTLTARLESASGEERTPILDELGLRSRELGDLDSSIAYFERSLAERETYGTAYNELLGLHNEKRAESARLKDTAAITSWSEKLDEHMALSKRILRSNY